MTDAPLFLVGFMGSGKTVVGRELASRLTWDAVDTDHEVERADGRAIERIMRESGEPRFRELEWRVLRSLGGRRRCVVSTGGGLFCRADARRLMRRSGSVVWLDVGLEVARQRVGHTGGRPLWRSADRVGLRSLYERRRAAYALAALRVDASSGTPGEVAEAVLVRLRSCRPPG